MKLKVVLRVIEKDTFKGNGCIEVQFEKVPYHEPWTCIQLTESVIYVYSYNKISYFVFMFYT